MPARLTEYKFNAPTPPGIYICAGGFEDRAVSYLRRVKKSHFNFSSALILRYASQFSENKKTFDYMQKRLRVLLERHPKILDIDVRQPNQNLRLLREEVCTLAPQLRTPTAVVDLSGMSQILGLSVIHACFVAGLCVKIAYTEAESYFPTKKESEILIRAWNNQNYAVAARYLQSQGLKFIHILPEFAGSFRPNKQTCLMIFLGYEPNRIEGLIEKYAPDRLVLLYGKSPHKRFQWRTLLTKQLHSSIIESIPTRRGEVSTLYIEQIMQTLEAEFDILHDSYEIAVAPQCSKMQAVATYLFWLRHPEIQLVFTSPARFNPRHYSHGTSRTFVYDLPTSPALGMTFAVR